MSFVFPVLTEPVPAPPNKQGAGPDLSIRTSGEPGGTRTRDPMIKSHVLYRLSYGLGPRVCTDGLVRGQ
jgi:hypothetical protein